VALMASAQARVRDFVSFGQSETRMQRRQSLLPNGLIWTSHDGLARRMNSKFVQTERRHAVPVSLNSALNDSEAWRVFVGETRKPFME